MDAVLKTRVGRYNLLRPLGAGGMAELFLARAEGIEGFTKLVALKRILPHRVSNEKFVRMFLAEARLVAGLGHPNIAQVYDIGQDCGEFFFTMEYVHGPDLGRILRAAPRRRLHLENTLHVVIGLCAGLHHAHEARDESGRSLEIVHRDVSPSNVLVSYQGAVKLVDFGVAKAASIVSETQDGIIKGKYGYMSPEQCLGEVLTCRSDVFNLGILLWEMTVGRRLYKVNGDLVALQRIVYVDAPKPSRYVENYPPELERIVMRALARDPEQRYQSAQQLQLELEGFALEHRIPVSPVSMSLEMRNLFRDRIEAWQAAQQAGRSLADHLAEISSDHNELKSSDELAADDPIDDVISSLDTGVFDEPLPGIATQADRPSRRSSAEVPAARPPTITPAAPSPAPAAPRTRSADLSTPKLAKTPPSSSAPGKQAIPARPRRSRALIIGALLFVLAGVAFGIVFVVALPALRDSSRSTIAASPIEPARAPVEPVRAPTGSATQEDTVPAEPVDAHADDPAIQMDLHDAGSPADGSQTVRRPTRPARPVRSTHTTQKPQPTKTHDDLPFAPEPAKPEPAKPEPAKPEPAKPEPSVPAGPKPGTIDPAGVRAVARAHLRDIETCVARARMENRDLAGRVLLRIDVSPTGTVTHVAVASSTGANAALEGCISRAVATWTFPAPAGGVKGAFTYPFAF